MQVLMRRPNSALLFGLIALAGFALFGIAIGVLMAEPAKVVGDRLAELTCLQVAFTPERYTAVFQSFPADMQQAALELLFPGDMVFAWGYGLLLAGLTGLLAMRLPGRWQQWGAFIFWAPLLAATFDCVEDVFLFTIGTQQIADPGAAVAAALPLLAGIAALLKYAALSVVTPAYGIAGIGKGLIVDRSVGALLLYAFLGLLLLSMILQPLQRVPLCF
jgi:hypothetical protein